MSADSVFLDSIQNAVQQREAFFEVLSEHLRTIDANGVRVIYRAMLAFYTVMTTTGDGHCLFRALSWTIFGHPEGHLRLRLLSCRILMDHSQFFSDNLNMLSTKRGVTFNDIVHATAILHPTSEDGWGDAYNIKSLAIAARRKVFVYHELLDPRHFDQHDAFMVIYSFELFVACSCHNCCSLGSKPHSPFTSWS